MSAVCSVLGREAGQKKPSPDDESKKEKKQEMDGKKPKGEENGSKKSK